MHRLARLCGKILLGSLAVLWLAYSVTYLTFNDATLGDFISRRVSAVDRGTFALRHARYPYWGGLASILFNRPVHVVGEDFTLRDPGGNPVIRVPHVDADAHLQELVVSLLRTALTAGHHFYLTLHFSRASIPSGWAVIAPTRETWGSPERPVENKEVNIVAAMSARHHSPPSGAFVIRVDEVELGHIAFAMAHSTPDGQRSWWARVDDLGARAGLQFSSDHRLATAAGPYFFFRLVELSAPQAGLQLGDYYFPLEGLHAAEFGVHGDVRQDLHFSATARALGAGVRAKGLLRDAYSEHPGVHLELDVDRGRGPLALLPPPLSVWLSGDPSAHITIDGPFSHAVIDGEVRDVVADVEGMHFTEGRAKLHFDEGRLTLRPAAGRIARGEASADIALDFRQPGRWSARVALRGVDPGAVPKLPAALGRQLSGRLDAVAQLSGSLYNRSRHVEIGRLWANLARTRAEGVLPRRLSIKGAGSYSPTTVVLRGVTAAGEGVTFAADGRLDPRTGRVDASLRIDGRARATLWRRWGAPAGLVAGRVRASGRLVGELTRPRLSLRAQAEKVGYLGRTLDRLEADLLLRDGELLLRQIRGAGLGASFEGSAELGLFDGELGRPRAVPTVRARLTARGLSLATVAGWLGVQGKADLDIALEGALAHPHGRAALSLPELTIQGDRYLGGALSLSFADDGATVQKLSLRRARGGAVTGSGHIGWDGALALRLVPRDFPLAAIPGLSASPVALTGTLSGDVTVGGSIDRPVPGGIFSLLAFKVRETLLGKGTLKLDPGSDAIHFGGSFFGNVTVDGYITLVPKVSVVATIRFQDLPLERFYPEVLQLAEVRALATGSLTLTIDSESGLTFAKLMLDALQLTLSSTDETGRPQRLVVRNPKDEPVVLTTDMRTLEIKHANLYSSIGEFTMHGTIGKVNNVYMRGRIGLELLEYFFRGLFEHTHGPANVELTISGDLSRPDVTGYVQIGGGKGPAELVPRGLDGKLTLVVPSGRIDITPQSVRLTEVALSTEQGKLAHASGEVQLNRWVPGAIRASISGEISPKLLQWRWLDQLADASGTLKLDVTVGGQWNHPQWRGVASIEKVQFRARKLERDVRIDKGTVIFDNYDVAVGCPRRGARPPGCVPLSGVVDDDSKITRVDGRISFGEALALKRLDVWIDGSELRYAQPAWAVSFSPRVELFGDGNQLTLQGNIDLVEGRYSQNFDLVAMVFRPKTVEVAEPFWQGIPLLETMRLNLHAQSTGSLLVKNNIADLSLTANLDIAGTLSEPRFDGNILVEEGGRLSPPGFRYAFSTEQGQVRFEQDKKIPDQTPTIDLTANTLYVDKNEQQHTLVLRLTGTALSPRLDLTSQEGWDRSQVLVILIGGQSPDDIRRITQGSATAVNQVGGSATDNIAKTVTGATLGQFLGDPLKRVTGFDTVNVEFGGNSFDLKLCKRLGRYFKTCGQGELGFAGSSRFGGSIELRLSDRPMAWSGVGSVEYLTRGVETLQDSLTSGRGELKLRVPLGY